MQKSVYLKNPSDTFQFLLYSSVLAYRLMLYMVPGCENENNIGLVKAPCAVLTETFATKIPTLDKSV